ncbi:MAG: hypothetical protein UHS41_00720 [Lachnospiraceae bacterium]|nr:hypothetical protein [Lachnospiraceae bacterium]
MKKETIYNSSQLTDFYELGLQVQVEDTLVNDENLQKMNQMVCEADCYMKDFIEDTKGEISKVHYTKVTQY